MLQTSLRHFCKAYGIEVVSGMTTEFSMLLSNRFRIADLTLHAACLRDQACFLMPFKDLHQKREIHLNPNKLSSGKQKTKKELIESDSGYSPPESLMKL